MLQFDRQFFIVLLLPQIFFRYTRYLKSADMTFLCTCDEHLADRATDFTCFDISGDFIHNWYMRYIQDDDDVNGEMESRALSAFSFDAIILFPLHTQFFSPPPPIPLKLLQFALVVSLDIFLTLAEWKWIFSAIGKISIYSRMSKQKNQFLSML